MNTKNEIHYPQEHNVNIDECENMQQIGAQMLVLPKGTRMIAIVDNFNICGLLSLRWNPKISTYTSSRFMSNTIEESHFQLLKKNNNFSSFFSSFVIFGTLFKQNDKCFFCTEKMVSCVEKHSNLKKDLTSSSASLSILLSFYQSFANVAKGLNREKKILHFIFPHQFHSPLDFEKYFSTSFPFYEIRGIEWIHPNLPTKIVYISNMNDMKKLITKEKKKEFEKTLFWIQPDIQNDIYHLFDFCEKKYCGLCSVPSFQVSKMLNDKFRIIKENKNIDLLEESDSEEEFTNISSFKYLQSSPPVDIMEFDERSAKLFACIQHGPKKIWIPNYSL